MATYYNNPNQRETAPMLYLREPLPGSFSETPALSGSMMMYMNSGSFSEALGGNSQPHSNCIDMSTVGGMDSTQQQQEVLSSLGGTRLEEHDFNVWRDGRNEMLVMHQHPLSSPTHSIISNGQNLHNQGLSLSLGSQIASGVQMPSSPYRDSNMGLVSFLSPHPSMSGEHGGRSSSLRDDHPRNIDCIPPGFPGGNHEMSRGDQSYGLSIIARIVPNSRYLKAAQQLLDEIVNVRKALKHPNDTKNQSAHDNQTNGIENADAKSKNNVSAKQEDSASNPSSELSQAEKQELQNKLTKLVSMLEEVDRRYRQYCNQMHVVVSSFDAIAGCSAAKPYTSLALQRISRQFRCLRDCISGQIQLTRKSLGEQDTSGNSSTAGIARLRYVDQQIRQQRALQQLGMMQQHAWRPQRGLPENSVSILRAWLFEHFLHPYPKDSDKIMLARQTGLTRSQVSNWFINARVRLWKPMVEEMYKEELGDMELDSNSSSENAVKASKGDIGSSEDKGESLQHSASSIANEKANAGKFIDAKSEHAREIEIGGSNGGGSFNNSTRGEVDTDYCEKPREEQRTNIYESSFFPDGMVQPDAGSSRFITDAAAAYHMSELERYGGGSDVSLTLGLQGGTLPLSGGMPHGFVAIRGDNFFGATNTSIGPETTGYESINPGNPQHRLSSSHLLHDFVA